VQNLSLVPSGYVFFSKLGLFGGSVVAEKLLINYKSYYMFAKCTTKVIVPDSHFWTFIY